VRQAYHGTLRSKAPGRATMPEIHEACGLDVDELQNLLTVLKNSDFVSLQGSYPYEELQLEGELVGDASIWETLLRLCDSTETPLERAIVALQFESWFAP
jgi:hypothetical protein